MAQRRTNAVARHVLKGMGKGETLMPEPTRGKGKGKTLTENAKRSQKDHWTAQWNAKPKKVREVWIMPEVGGGMTVYCSGSFEEGRGKWFEAWHEPNAVDHYDIWWATEWKMTGHYFWPEGPEVTLTDVEYANLFPGLKNNGVPDAKGNLHYPPKRQQWWYAKNAKKRERHYAKKYSASSSSSSNS